MSEDIESVSPTPTQPPAAMDGNPARCGTMLLYAGLIRLSTELCDEASVNSETEGPAFL